MSNKKTKEVEHLYDGQHGEGSHEGLRSKLYLALIDLVEILEESEETLDSLDIFTQLEELITTLGPFYEPSPATKVMHTGLILEGIFEYLDEDDLINFRLVCRQWNVISLSTLARSKSLKLKYNDDNLGILDLESLLDSLEGSKRLPIKVLELDISDWYLHDKKMSPFFKLHGPHIHTLIFTGGSGGLRPKVVIEKIFNLLTSVFLQVKEVRIGSDFVVPSLYMEELFFNPQIGQEPYVLPSVKKISFESWQNPQSYMIHILLTAAVNLDSVHGSFQSVVTTLFSLDKIEVLKTYFVKPDNVEDLLLLAMAEPKLERLTISIRQEISVSSSLAFKSPIKNIIESSRDSLKYLSIDTHHCSAAAVDDRSYPNLKYLRLSDRFLRKDGKMEGIICLFPDTFVLAYSFPNLETLVLELQRLDKNSLKAYFPGDDFNKQGKVDTLLTVKSLVLHSRFTRFGIKALAKKFPNVKSIEVKDYKEFFLNDDSLWYLPWPLLERLELKGFSFGEQFWDRSMDSFFTGFSDEICGNLRGILEEDLMVDLKVVTRFPSVRNLHQLKALRIVFDRPNSLTFPPAAKWDTTGRKIDLSKVISHLTGKYAFSKMSKLDRVTFVYNNRMSNSKVIGTALNSLLSFPVVKVERE